MSDDLSIEILSPIQLKLMTSLIDNGYVPGDVTDQKNRNAFLNIMMMDDSSALKMLKKLPEGKPTIAKNMGGIVSLNQLTRPIQPTPEVPEVVSPDLAQAQIPDPLSEERIEFAERVAGRPILG